MTLRELREQARDLGISGFSKMNTEQVTAAIAAKQGPQPIEVPETDGEGSVKVARSRHDNIIRVTWLCGAERHFAPEELRAAIERFEQISAHGIWYEDLDSAGGRYAAVLVDGEFHGDDHVNGSSGHVPWAQLKAALESHLQPASTERTR